MVLPRPAPPISAPNPGPLVGRRAGVVPVVSLVLAAMLVPSCGQTLDAGANQYGPLSVGTHNPVILVNDSWSDNWSPEYAALLANQGGPPLSGIVVNATQYWPDLDANLAGWRDFVAAARSSGLRNVPDPLRSPAPQLVVPPDRQVASTRPNNSPGAQLIVRKSRELALPGQPLVVVSGTQLTDIADAYLLDPSVVERVVVVAQLGSYAEPRAAMGSPNGDLDPWADWIVAQYFTYVQISVYYDQGVDVTPDDLPKLPANPFGAWMSTKQAKVSKAQNAADQGAILAVADASFDVAVVPGKADTSPGFNVPPGQGPSMVPSPDGNGWLVTQIDPAAPRARLWQMLTNPGTFQ